MWSRNDTIGQLLVAGETVYQLGQRNMATRSIEQAFSKFHSDLTPSSYMLGKAASHKASITSRLEKDFDLKQLFYSGSANNGTSISAYSDVDFFASIPTKKLKKNSATSLREIKESLQARFRHTNVYVDSPAIVLDFGTASWDTAEVIPADYIDQVNGKNVFDIPDGSGLWMRSSPGSHNSYVAQENTRLHKKLKPLIRFIKAWKYFRNVPISSFYLELRITKWMQDESIVIYDIDLCRLLSKLNSCALAAIQDPKGVSGYVYPCKSTVHKSDALSKVATASKRAENAREAARAGKIKDSFDWWDLVFNGRFPSYYY